jgi:glycosyltransferase involved in cell wall biosynthesis
MTHTRSGARFIRAVLGDESALSYAAWIEANDQLTPADRAAIADHIGRMAAPPLISVVMPVYAVEPRLLTAAIASVQAQLYPHWELCLADDASPGDSLWNLLTEAAARDSRIKVIRRAENGHICAATNSALALARGDFVALMDHDDILAERALYEVAAELERRPDADIVYSDEDKIDEAGRRFGPYFKTGWNPELAMRQNMVSHLGVYRRSLVEAVGGLRVGFEGSQDWDLTLRVAEQTKPSRIRHIPWPLYHWRQGGAGSFSERQLARCAASARRAVEEHLARTGRAAKVTFRSRGGAWLEVRPAVPDPRPSVTVIIPTRDRARLLARSVEGVLRQTRYPDLELIVVDNGSVEPATAALFARLRADPRVLILDAPGPFNFSRLNNLAAAKARGEVLVLLNNDISMPDDEWLDALMAHAVRPSVGAVGARLLFPNGAVQHAGVILGVGSDVPVAAHLGYGQARRSAGYFDHLKMTRNVSAVTAACLAVRKSVYEEVGGFDEQNLAVAFNDVDFCLKLRDRGYDVIWTAQAELIHHESASRGVDAEGEAHARFQREVAIMRARWGPVLDDDPFYGPNFDRHATDYRLAERSRRPKPWAPAEAPAVAPAAATEAPSAASSGSPR